ncbi:outer membrane protein OmpA [Verminephrobacter eiseniae]|uniref:outer membrane protein OmpA n=1 Tax=Verminephrobacter eiseniae TaxID=364317 RepID=UPI0010D807DB|nr:OmpA family protein [Verminephrobacter eiseniae]KAB7614115.1 OmpA family protein [Verminephrobacter sp. Larva24]MCW5231567.1 OmpA family protein [Verminephrobacter eiseniae]MCW5293296.1 OmpA family protein [Verminephrobacter eiseniae]MCW8186962.1 OmpA family protein [Verminephrobacter eiseniae]MCW8225348.1 OmpA family protein [Verminephrobacter eiseniae]
MKKLNKVAMLFASATLAAAAGAQSADNWRDASGQLAWKNGSNEHCWRNANWTPATASAGCDSAIATTAAAAAAAATPATTAAAATAAAAQKAAPTSAASSSSSPAAAAGQTPATASASTPAPAVATKVTYATDAFFDFDKSVIKPEGKAKLDDLVSKVKDINLEVIIAVGHTDSVGTDAYNQRLSVRRSEAVKAYLVSKGIEKNRVYTEGKGEKQPVADNKTAEGRAKNRRVEIEVVGTRASK